MKTRLALVALIALGASLLSSCGDANSVGQTTGRMFTAMSRIVR